MFPEVTRTSARCGETRPCSSRSSGAVSTWSDARRATSPASRTKSTSLVFAAKRLSSAWSGVSGAAMPAGASCRNACRCALRRRLGWGYLDRAASTCDRLLGAVLGLFVCVRCCSCVGLLKALRSCVFASLALLIQIGAPPARFTHAPHEHPAASPSAVTSLACSGATSLTSPLSQVQEGGRNSRRGGV